MAVSTEIQYLQRSGLDAVKWDHCLDRASNGLIYGYSFYLDHMSPNWNALVLGDYECVMPLTWNRKWGVSYLFQPPFTQQLGIFSVSAITEKVIDLFLQKVRDTFPFAEICLNYANHAIVGVQQLNNFVLSLAGTYAEIAAGYKKDLRKNLRHAENFSLDYVPDLDLEIALKGYQELYAHRTPHVSNSDFRHFHDLCVSKPEHIVLRAVRSKEKELLASALLLRKNGRLHLVQSTTWPVGRIREANHFLIDRIIAEFSETNLLLDFEGSDIDGIAHFYLNFGSHNEPYYFYRHNRLPWPWKVFKK